MPDAFHDPGDGARRLVRPARLLPTRRGPTERHFVAWCAIALTLAICSRAVGVEPVSPASVLYLRDGDFLAGRLENCDTPNIVCWQAQGAMKPFEFSAGAFRAAYFPTPASPPAPIGEYCFELVGGDILYGALLNVTPQQFEIEAARFGKLRIDRDQVARISVVGDSLRSDYRGPKGLAEWHASAENQWTEEAGRLVTSTRNAEVRKQLVIPDQARIEFEIAWSENPNFSFVLSAGGSDEQLQAGYRFEVWDRQLVVSRSDKSDADVAYIFTLNVAADRIHLEAFYDQATGKFSVHSLDGRELGQITVLEHAGMPLRLVSLTNLGPNVRLEQLVIGRWSGQPPAQVDADQSRLQLTDGTIIQGDITGFDPESKQFTVRADVEDKHIEAAQLACITLSHSAQNDATSFLVGLHDGSRIQGDLTKVADGKLYISRRGIDLPLVCEIADVRSLVGMDSNYQRPGVHDRVARLELDGVHSHGTLVEAAAAAEGAARCLVWKPLCSATSSPLDPDASGRIVYRDPPPAPRKLTQREQQLQRLQQQRRQPQPPGIAGAFLRVLSGGDQMPESNAPPKPRGASTLYLLGGDRIPCQVSEIDEAGVHFTSPVVVSTFVPNSGVKALEFTPQWTEAALDDIKRQRLLTLPRMQKANPPTHLIVSTTGDYLRTRLTTMTADTLNIESHLETKQVARDRVACIIWLHDASDPALAASPDNTQLVTAAPATLRVQAVQSDGVRLTFEPQDCTATQLSGTSKSLGACRIDLSRVDALVFGNAIGSDAAEQAFQSWKLSDAIEPRYLRDATSGNGGQPPAGTESDLVGKKAPDIRLELLEGGRFNLAEHKGHIVVLDFWASWCGPCMQAMPQVDAVVEEFATQGVQLVAINMQEDHAAANGALERLKIHPSVALDVDGAAAEHYQVSAIPETVVVDADGKVAQVFIGSDPEFPAQLRSAIEATLPQPNSQ
jgi:thiol-disulfide isomerase/thioredoxin